MGFFHCSLCDFFTLQRARSGAFPFEEQAQENEDMATVSGLLLCRRTNNQCFVKDHTEL